VRYLRLVVSDPQSPVLRVAPPEGAPSGVLPPPTLLLLRETLYQACQLEASPHCISDRHARHISGASFVSHDLAEATKYQDQAANSNIRLPMIRTLKSGSPAGVDEAMEHYVPPLVMHCLMRRTAHPSRAGRVYGLDCRKPFLP
jgi:hypothetical protein